MFDDDLEELNESVEQALDQVEKAAGELEDKQQMLEDFSDTVTEIRNQAEAISTSTVAEIIGTDENIFNKKLTITIDEMTDDVMDLLTASYLDSADVKYDEDRHMFTINVIVRIWL